MGRPGDRGPRATSDPIDVRHDQPIGLGDDPGADGEVAAAETEGQHRRGQRDQRGGQAGQRHGQEGVEPESVGEHPQPVCAQSDVRLLAHRQQAGVARQEVPHLGEGQEAQDRWSTCAGSSVEPTTAPRRSPARPTPRPPGRSGWLGSTSPRLNRGSLIRPPAWRRAPEDAAPGPSGTPSAPRAPRNPDRSENRGSAPPRAGCRRQECPTASPRPPMITAS